MGFFRILCLVIFSIILCGSASVTASDAVAIGNEPISSPGFLSSDKDYYIVQFAGPILPEWKEEAAGCGVELLDYLPDFSFAARATRSAISNISALPFVTTVAAFPSEYKISPKLLKRQGNIKLIIQGFNGEPITALKTPVLNAGGRVLAESSLGSSIIRAELPAAAIAALSRIKEIAWIEPYVEPKFANKVARSVTAVSQAWQDLGFYGAGQIVGVSDTGLDNGQNDSTMNADFRGRIVAAYARARTGDWSDMNGHGTHVCGSLLGNGVLSGSNPTMHKYDTSFAGIAPEASLVIQSIGAADNSLVLPSKLSDLFQQAYNDGAKIHSNSWGAATSGGYTSNCYYLDLFNWNNKDMLILFSAGNLGVDQDEDGVIDPGSVESPGSAKNCITVGASENLVPTKNAKYGSWWPSKYSHDPFNNDLVADNISGMAAFSSRGPTEDGRIKPDISAPGTFIISARSQVGSETLWGVYNNNYLYGGGTSMSSPIVAGAAAVLREYLKEVKNITPSAALLKAALLNSADNTEPGQYGTGQYREIPSVSPNSVQGWGILNLKNAIQPDLPNIIDFNEGTGLQTNGTQQYTYNVYTDAVPFKATLAWTDYPGSQTLPGSSKRLVNDLDIQITGPNAEIFRGNNGVDPDRTNNVETVHIASPTPGTYTITVKAYNVPKGPQPYALVVSGAFGDEPISVSTIADAKSMPNGTLLSLTGKIITAGIDVFDNHFYIEELDRTSGIKISYPGGVAPTGRLVSVTGNLKTDGWEKRIDATRVTLSSAGTIPDPFGMRNNHVGGLGLAGSLGPENTGLLIKVWGEVKSHGSNHIIINDGQKLLKVRTGSLSKPDVGSYVSVTGISAVDAGDPIVKARFTSDITIHKAEP